MRQCPLDPEEPDFDALGSYETPPGYRTDHACSTCKHNTRCPYSRPARHPWRV